jgi:hypothetical protein
MVLKPEEYPYSSYEYYINKKKEEIIYRDLILNMVSNNKKTRFNDYMKFVQNAINGEIEDPLRKVYAGTILGKTQFIKNLLDNVKDDIGAFLGQCLNLDLHYTTCGNRVNKN